MYEYTHWDTVSQSLSLTQKSGAPFCLKTRKNPNKKAFLKLA